MIYGCRQWKQFTLRILQRTVKTFTYFQVRHSTQRHGIGWFLLVVKRDISLCMCVLFHYGVVMLIFIHSVLVKLWRLCVVVVLNYVQLAVSTRPPDGDLSRASRSNSLAFAPLSGFLLALTRWQLLLLLLMLLRAWFMVIRQVAQAWILYIARTDKWPWPWLKHSLDQHESPYAKFGLDRPSRSAGHRQQANK